MDSSANWQSFGIAILSAALNYALTGTGLKENIIKILKATLFCIIVLALYPRIIGWISWYTSDLAQRSIYKHVKDHFNTVTNTVLQSYDVVIPSGSGNVLQPNQNVTDYYKFTNYYYTNIILDKSHLFSDLIEENTFTIKGVVIKYTVVSPANVLKIVFFIAGECIGFADNKKITVIPDFSRILKGLICAGVIIFTGAFALLEYVVCFLEFMLVASVGIILLPMSIWEGSKFLSEGFIKAIFGFFIKLLFCNLAIFLLIYGFITLFYIIAYKPEGGQAMGFQGNLEQIIFITFSCMLFLFICKSAPGIAQSLLTGSPSLTGAGAVGAVAGAVGAVAGAAGMAKGAVSKTAGTGGALVGGIAKTGGTLIEAGAAAKAAGAAGNSKSGAFMRSLARNASQGLARSIYGNQSEDRATGKTKTLGDINNEIKTEGTTTGRTTRSF